MATFFPIARVDLALVDVLPNPADSGKDLGVFTIANALPQTLATGAGRRAVGASIVLPIKGVR